MASGLLERAKEGDSAACEQLLEENSRLIWSVVRRFIGRGAEQEDLYQLGCIGFLKALKGFDQDYGTCFSTYAVPKIAGEMRRYLRDNGAVKVSRGIREQGYSVYKARSQLLDELGREPTLSELSSASGLSPEEITMADQAASPVVSLQADVGEGIRLEQILPGEDTEEAMLEQLSLHDAIANLPERERLVISLRYFHDLTQQQTARIVGVSQVQVSRIEKKAIESIRKAMETKA